MCRIFIFADYDTLGYEFSCCGCFLLNYLNFLISCSERTVDQIPQQLAKNTRWNKIVTVCWEQLIKKLRWSRKTCPQHENICHRGSESAKMKILHMRFYLKKAVWNFYLLFGLFQQTILVFSIVIPCFIAFNCRVQNNKMTQISNILLEIKPQV